MAAGAVGLEKVFTPQRARELHARGDKLRSDLNDAGKGTMMKVVGCGSLMAIHFTGTPLEKIRSPEDLEGESMVLQDLFHLWMLNRGFYIARRGFLALSLALGEEDLESFSKEVQNFLEDFKAVVEI